MNINKLRKRILLVLICLPALTHAQMVKEISVSQAAPYTDHLSLKEDSRDMDLMVKFVFNEEDNTLTVNLISYRMLFVFWDQVRYKPTFRGRTLRPKMLPYVAESNPDERFRVSKVLKWSIPRPRKKYVFNRWNTYEGLQPVPQDYKIVNDYISQTFDILNKRNQVSLTLRDIFVMEHKGFKDYEIFFGKDLYTRYQVTIERNPCFGRDDERQRAQEAFNSIASAYSNFHDRYGSGQVMSNDGLSVFREVKDALTSQFPVLSVYSDCQEIQSLWDGYNQYAERIRKMSCKVASSTSAGGGGEQHAGIQASNLLLKTRQIDQMVARWLNSRDPIERRDMVKNCEALIKQGNDDIHSQGVYTAEQRRAVSLFREAERYYIKVCK